MRKDVNGLVMIAASLLVIGAVIALVAHRELVLRQEQTRAYGIGLANTLSRVPLRRLVSSDVHLGPLIILRSTQSNSSFAYAVVVDPAGKTLENVSVANVEAPLSATPRDPTLWSAEKLVSSGEPPTFFHEFSAPLLEDGEFVGQIRIGFVEPDYKMVFAASSFHAGVALLVFLLTPLAFLWLRREMRPLGEVASQLESGQGASGGFPGNARAPDMTIDGLVRSIRVYSEEVEERTLEMDRERMSLLAASRVLSHKKNRIESVLESIPDAVLAIDETGKLILANARTESLLRIARDELMGSPPSAWCPAQEVVELIGRHSRSTGQLMRSESVEFCLDELGTRRYSASVCPVASGNGTIVVIRDVSVEHAAKKNQAEFLAHMAHELKAPLNVMGMYSESLLGPEANDEAFRVDACNVIRDEIDRLNGLINNIFSIGRIESGNATLNRQRIRIREMLHDVFDAASRGGQEMSLAFDAQLPEHMNPIYADKPLLTVVLQNLLTNAIKYNREGGKVGLIAEELEEGLSIRITDSGIGIPEEDLDEIFDKFFRSDDPTARKVSGHGLGLSLVKEIVALHGGEIRVASEPGEGSEFTIFFGQNSAIFREEN